MFNNVQKHIITIEIDARKYLPLFYQNNNEYKNGTITNKRFLCKSLNVKDYDYIIKKSNDKEEKNRKARRQRIANFSDKHKTDDGYKFIYWESNFIKEIKGTFTNKELLIEVSQFISDVYDIIFKEEIQGIEPAKNENGTKIYTAFDYEPEMAAKFMHQQYIMTGNKEMKCKNVFSVELEDAIVNIDLTFGNSSYKDYGEDIYKVEREYLIDFQIYKKYFEKEGRTIEELDDISVFEAVNAFDTKINFEDMMSLIMHTCNMKNQEDGFPRKGRTVNNEEYTIYCFKNTGWRCAIIGSEEQSNKKLMTIFNHKIDDTVKGNISILENGRQNITEF